MTLLEEIKSLKTDTKALRDFGLWVGGIFATLGVLFLVKERPAGPILFSLGLPLVALGLLWPRGLKEIYIAWMTFAFMIGAVMARVILTLLFYLAITPISLLARLFGQRFLNFQFKSPDGSYWIAKQKSKLDKKNCEVQF